jgi:uncharacterized protein
MNGLATPESCLLQTFGQHMRQSAAPLDNPRLSVYHRLFTNNIFSLLAQSFPVTQALLGKAQFKSLVEHFYLHHRAQTPRFTELAPEFLGYCQTLLPEKPELCFGHAAQALIELLHYEWIETELALSADPMPVLADGEFLLSPHARILAYQFPVHRMSAKQPPPTLAPEQATYLLVWRDPHFDVKFQELNLAAVQLLLPFQQIVNQLPIDAEALAQVRRWLDLGVLVGGDLLI